MLRLNLASGQRPFEKWINVDIREQFKDDGTPYKIDLISDIRKLDTIKDETVDQIVISHAVEHIQLNDLLDSAKEWHRVLKKGGQLLVTVPNLRALAEAWLQGKINNYIFFVNTYGAYQGFQEDTHKWGFDFNELKDRLSGWNGTTNELTWDQVSTVDGIQIRNLFQDCDIATDWWILSVLFIK